MNTAHLALHVVAMTGLLSLTKIINFGAVSAASPAMQSNTCEIFME
jgi:hypothetical protein